MVFKRACSVQIVESESHYTTYLSYLWKPGKGLNLKIFQRILSISRLCLVVYNGLNTEEEKKSFFVY